MRIKCAGQFGGQSGTFHSSGWDTLDVGNLPSHQRKVDFKINHFDLLVGALNLFVKCHGEQENHKMNLDYSKTAFSQ